MIVWCIVYGLLILTAIVILPLRIRSRRKTLREIESLRLEYRKDVSKLLETIRDRDTSETQEESQLKKRTIQHNWMVDDLNDYSGKLIFGGAVAPLYIRLCASKEPKRSRWQESWQYKKEQDDWAFIEEHHEAEPSESWIRQFQKHNVIRQSFVISPHPGYIISSY